MQSGCLTSTLGGNFLRADLCRASRDAPNHCWSNSLTERERLCGQEQAKGSPHFSFCCGSPAPTDEPPRRRSTGGKRPPPGPVFCTFEEEGSLGIRFTDEDGQLKVVSLLGQAQAAKHFLEKIQCALLPYMHSCSRRAVS